MIEQPFVTMREARRLLGGCSRSYLYQLINAGKLKSVNPFGRRRMVAVQSIRRLLRK